MEQIMRQGIAPRICTGKAKREKKGGEGLNAGGNRAKGS